MTQNVFIAGASGYLGRFLCQEYQRRGWHVTALVRKSTDPHGIGADQLVTAEATWPEALSGTMQGADLVISALGITRQSDGVGYWDVDYQANVNLLNEALRSGVDHFAYVHVLNADRMSHVPMVAAKSAFVRKLQSAAIGSTVIAPSGYFSDMGDFLNMARKGRVWLFGAGQQRINPIHGADLAQALATAVGENQRWLDVGGPQTFTHQELAELAFACLGQQPRISFLPDFTRRAALFVVPKIMPRPIAGPMSFFLTAMGMNMVGTSKGTHLLKDHFEGLILAGE